MNEIGMNLASNSDEMPEHFIQLRDLLDKESDRGSVLVGAAALDDALRSLLTKFFVDDQKSCEELLEPSGNLGTFSARINVCYLSGLISQDARVALHRIRKIRNSFAHSRFDTTFQTQSISDQCCNLPCTRSGQSARQKFEVAVSYMYGFLQAKIDTQKRVFSPINNLKINL